MGRFSDKFHNEMFKNILRWHEWDAFVAQLRAESDGKWFVYFVGEDVPAEPLSREEFPRILGELDALLRRDHKKDYLGIVYADSIERPTMIKIFDPKNLGSSCGIGGAVILPGWVLSRLPPEDLGAHHESSEGRKRWWQKLFG